MATTPATPTSTICGSHSLTTTTDSSGARLRPLSAAGSKRLFSFPSRQRRMGPAPLASFEDLSMDKTTSESSSPEEHSILPNIGEETCYETELQQSAKPPENLAVPASPQIRVSGSSTPQSDSKDSTPDQELFTGYAKSSFCEQMSDLKSSTEELEGDEDDRSRKRIRERVRQLKEMETREDRLKKEDLSRKESSSSVMSEGLIPVTSGHSSRLSSLGSIGSRRSPSPHRMLLETSFCGSKPIKNPSIDLEDPPVTTKKLMNITVDQIERVKSPIDARPPDIFKTPSHSPVPFLPRPDDFVDNVKTPLAFTKSDPESIRKKLTQELEEKLEQQRQKLEMQEEHVQKIVEKRHKRQKLAIQKQLENAKPPQQEPMEDMYISTPKYQRSNSKSPRLGKKVPTPQVPELKDFNRRSPSPSVMHANMYDIYTGIKIDQSAQFYSDSENTPSSIKEIKSKDFDEKDSNNSSPSFSRKSSHSSLLRKSEQITSPLTPDSPVTSNGRKSPFSTFMKSAEDKFRSRSRSRSRSKSRERELDDDTHDRREFLLALNAKKEEERRLAEEKSNKEKEEARLSKDSTSSNNSNKSSKLPSVPTKSHKSKSSVSDDDIFDKPAMMSIEQSIQEKLKTRPHKRDIDASSKSEKRKTTELAPDFDQDPDSISESDKITDVDFYKSKKSSTTDQMASPDVENKGLVSQDSFEDGELPYVPTSLPQERPVGEPIIPVRERQAVLKPTQSIERPRSTTPIQPSRLEEFASNMSSAEDLDIDKVDKMTINIAGAVKVLPTKSPKRQTSKSWEDFCQEGLKSPRQLRKEYKESRESSKQSTIDEPLPPPFPPPLPPKNFRSPNRSPRSAGQTPDTPLSMTPDSIDTPTSVSPKTWVNFEDIPDVTLKPVRQIKTAPTRRTPHAQDKKKHQMQLQQEQLQQQLQQQLKQRLKEQQEKVDQQILNEAQGKQLEVVQSDIKTLLENSDNSQDSQLNIPIRRHSLSSPERDDSSAHSSDSDDKQSCSSSEDLTTVRERIYDIKGRNNDQQDNSDLERLLAPVNDCISHSLRAVPTVNTNPDRKSPIPDNWSDFLLPPQPGRRSRLSSIGSESGSIGGARSPSPSHMILETSFCGSQPIDDPAMVEPNVPMSVARKMSGISLGEMSPLATRGDRASLQSPSFYSNTQPDRVSIISDQKTISRSSSDELGMINDIKNSEHRGSQNSDLERLLAPVNDCISHLSSLATGQDGQKIERKSPIPDNWADFLLPPQPGRRSRLSSLGSDAGSVGGARSPSPSHMILETSFCGSQPIDDPALTEPDVPISVARKMSGISLGDLSPLGSRGDRSSLLTSPLLLASNQYTQPDRASIMSDSSAEGGSPRGSDIDPREASGISTGISLRTGQLNPFGMDLGYKSNRSSIVSQEQVWIIYLLNKMQGVAETVLKFADYYNNMKSHTLY